MNRPVKLNELVETIIEGFNRNNNSLGNPEKYRIEIIEREIQTSYKANMKDKRKIAKAHVGTLLLHLERDSKSKIIFNLDIPLKSKYSDRLTTDWENDLLKQFLYECIGMFNITVTGMIDRREKASFDLENNRFEADEFWKGKKVKVVITILVNGVENETWYKSNEEFDIFTKTDDGWAVFSTLEEHKVNKGIATIPGFHARLIED